MSNDTRSYTHYVKCRSCGNVVALWELPTVNQWPTGWHGNKDEGFVHGCASGDRGFGTTAPVRIDDGPLNREEALKLLPFGRLRWR